MQCNRCGEDKEKLVPVKIYIGQPKCHDLVCDDCAAILNEIVDKWRTRPTRTENTTYRGGIESTEDAIGI